MLDFIYGIKVNRDATVIRGDDGLEGPGGGWLARDAGGAWFDGNGVGAIDGAIDINLPPAARMAGVVISAVDGSKCQNRIYAIPITSKLIPKTYFNKNRDGSFKEIMVDVSPADDDRLDSKGISR